MFKSISWQEYLLAISLIAGVYYFIVIAIFYSRDIVARLKGAAVVKPQITATTAERKPPGNFMGAIQKEVPRRKIITETVAAAEEITVDEEKQKAQSPAEQIIEQLEGMFNMMSEGVLEKSRYIKNIKSIISDCWKHKGTPVQVEVAAFIVSHFSGNKEVSFTIEEIDILWPSQEIETINQSTTTYNYETERKNDRNG